MKEREKEKDVHSKGSTPKVYEGRLQVAEYLNQEQLGAMQDTWMKDTERGTNRERMPRKVKERERERERE